MVDICIDNIVHNDMYPWHSRTFNVYMKDCESDILITRDQDNEQLILNKYKNIRFLGDEENQNYMITQ